MCEVAALHSSISLMSKARLTDVRYHSKVCSWGVEEPEVSASLWTSSSREVELWGAQLQAGHGVEQEVPKN